MSAPVEISLSPDVALRILYGDGCEVTTTRRPGDCLISGRSPVARYGVDKACSSCIAAAALGLIEWPGD